ncbi:UDP-2,3-diacylglucosamine hydrolase [Filimonas sp.]|nr:UDP-2,3-diacylglucosamine hydrolase [Filimonas sp.]
METPITDVDLQEGKKIYFASDFHFGIPNYEETRKRELRVCQWLDRIKTNAQQVYLLGDLFDSWMEYKKVVPKGTIRFLGKLAELSDAGIDIIIFTGNHDLWMHGYFEQELNVRVYKSAQTFRIAGKLFHLAHGDGVAKEDKKYRWLKGLLHHPVSQWIYRQLHPDIGLRLADFFSRLGPKHKYEDLQMKPDEQEYQLLYANALLKETTYDYFIFGHRHIPCCRKLNTQATFVNLGDWIAYDTFAVFDGQEISLLKN